MNEKKYGLYSGMITMGRMLKRHPELAKENPENIFMFVHATAKMAEGTPVQDFFNLFPPIKHFEDDGTWDYYSTKKLIAEMGENFTEESFISLLSKRCYENRFIGKLGLGFHLAMNELYRRETGHGLMEKIFSDNGIPVYQERNGELKPKFFVVK